MDKSKYGLRYEERFKHLVCLEYLKGNQSKTAIQNKYGIRGKTTLLKWLRVLGYIGQKKCNIEFPKTSSVVIIENLPTSSENQDQKALEAQIKALQEQLKNANLELEGYKLMLDLAEKEYKIAIRKKSDTK
jgi:transposase-like protein